MLSEYGTLRLLAEDYDRSCPDSKVSGAPGLKTQAPAQPSLSLRLQRRWKGSEATSQSSKNIIGG